MVWTLTLALTLLLALTALLGVWAAYDRQAAWARFGLIAAGLGLMLAIAYAGSRSRAALGWIAAGLALLAGAIGAYFLLSYNWAAGGNDKFAFVRQAGLWVQAHRPAFRVSEDINANVAGGALAILLPLGLAGAAYAWSLRGRAGAGRAAQRAALGQIATLALAVASTLALALASLALLLTASRGAWIGLAAGGLVAGVLAWRASSPGPASDRLIPAVLAWLLPAALLLILALAFWAAVALPGFGRFFGAVAGAGSSAVNRAALWRDMLALAGDYPFTGSGLGATMMAFSTYVMLLHVGFITHAHNLFLQIAIEQGLPGLAAFTALVGLALWALLDGLRRGPGRGFSLAAIAALVALVVHGMVDAGLYASRLAPVLFIPAGFGLAAGFGARAAAGAAEPAPAGSHPVSGRSFSTSASTIALVAVLALALILALSRPVRAAFQANLGAASQTRAELSVYTWLRWPIQDALRRAPEVDLAPAVARYTAALALDPGNVTAQRRLGQIALARGEYGAARAYFEAAFRAAPAQRAVRLLLGESYAVAGDPAGAAALWRTVDTAQGQLDGRRWWHEHLGEGQIARSIGEAKALAGQ